MIAQTTTMRVHRNLISYALLGGILGFQIVVSLLRIHEPILDGKKHWYHDNAFFLLKAKHSNYQPPDPGQRRDSDYLKIFGTATYGYDAGGGIGPLTYYSHHPILGPALFRPYARVLGYDPWVPRSFSLIQSLCTTIVLFLFLRTTLRHDWLSALLTFLYALLPLNFMYMDQFNTETMPVLLLLISLYALSKAPGSGKYRTVFLTSLFFMFQTDWNVYFAAPCILFYLFARRGVEGMSGLYLKAGIVSLLAVATNFAVLRQLGFDLDAILSVGTGRISGGMENVGLEDWLFRQLAYLDLNFGLPNLLLYLSAMVYVFVRVRHGTNILLFGSLSFAFAGICWVGIFKNLSLNHHYVQWFFGPAYVLLLGGCLAELPQGAFGTRKGRIVVLAVMLPLLALTAWDSRELNEEIRGTTFGSSSDIDVIRGLHKRLIIFSDGRSGPVDWWFSPVVEMAQDPIFRGAGAKGSVATIEGLSSLNPESDLLVIVNTERAWTSLQRFGWDRLGVTGLRLVKRCPAFSFLAFQIGGTLKTEPAMPG